MDTIVPDGMQWHYTDWHLSPMVVHGGVAFLSGVTATRDDGSCAPDPADEFTDAFDKLGRVLRAGGLGFGDVLEMTTYHIGLRDHLDVFREVKDRYLAEPWPAWSAIGRPSWRCRARASRSRSWPATRPPDLPVPDHGANPRMCVFSGVVG